MSKKFGNLGLNESLSSFVRNKPDEAKPSFNPLTDKKPRARKKVEAKPEKKSESKVEETPVEQPKSVEAVKATPSKEPKSKAKPKVSTKKVKKVELPNDFKTHSALFSSTQLDELRNLVNFKKWKVDPKFTIQQAIYEALAAFLQDRQPVKDFPADFVTYSPGFSVSQWEHLEKLVPEIRFKENGKYALKYAIYEAIQMYLISNPIKF